MQRHRFLIPNLDFTNPVRLDDRDVAHQLKDVLKILPNEEVQLFDGAGHEFVCVVLEYGKKHVTLEAIAAVPLQPAAGLKTTLYCAVLKHDHFELVAQKATEIGVVRIVPVITQRTVKLGVNMDRLTRIVKEATEQSGQSVMPELSEPVLFTEALQQVKNSSMRAVFCDFSDSQLGVADVQSTKDVALFIGPEGGWSREERMQAESTGCIVRSLGVTTLRAETAAIAALYVVVNSQALCK